MKKWVFYFHMVIEKYVFDISNRKRAVMIERKKKIKASKEKYLQVN